jgi:hypothetical protein
MSESTSPGPEWEEQPDGSRVPFVDGMRIVDRRDGGEQSAPIEHLVAREEADGRVVILGLDADCRAVYTTTLERRV